MQPTIRTNTTVNNTTISNAYNHDTKRLREIQNDIMITYTESKELSDVGKVSSCHSKIMALNTEAKKIFASLEKTVGNLDTSKYVGTGKIDTDMLIKLLSRNDLNFDELMSAFEHFCSRINDIPTKCNIKNNIETEIICEEDIIESNEL
jgi:hypothetical protein